jgi:hypothetical protein
MNNQTQLQRDLRRLNRSMDFVSRHPALKRDTKEARRFAEIYQQLGLAWEFLALQCRHRDGWRKLRDGKSACKVCGLIRGVKEQWLLLPRDGKKTIGRRALPNSKRTFPSRKAATVVNDALEFHGAKLNVEVLNLHRSRLFRRNDILCAADRLVRLEEAGVEYRLAEHTLDIRLRPRRRGEEPPFSTFVFELPRRALKRFPVMLQYDRRGRFVGVVIFKPLSIAAGKRRRMGSAATKAQRRK